MEMESGTLITELVIHVHDDSVAFRSGHNR